MKCKNIKIYDKLPKDAIDIREIVFVEEQGFKYEFDDIDAIATHIVIYERDDQSEKPIATCRYYKDKDGSYLIGRIAVIKEKRGEHLGAFLIEAAEKQIEKIGCKHFKIHAQCRVQKFYEKQGYVAKGDVDDEEGIPHIWMYKTI